MKSKATGLRRIFKAAGYSLNGLKAAYKNEAAFREETWLFILLAPLALYLGDTGIEKSLLLLSLFMVFIAELLNSAVEAVVDRVGPEYHELSGRAKDIGSAAVLIALVQAAVIWMLVLFG